MTVPAAKSHPYQLGFNSLKAETAPTTLSVSGTIPTWLNGVLIRNGPALFEIGAEKYRHWFDGLAMLHRFGFNEGQLVYQSKFLESPAYQAALKFDQIVYREYGTNPRSNTKPEPGGSPAGINANINVGKIGENYVAFTESPLPLTFDLTSLKTAGIFQFADNLALGHTTPHPHFDPQKGEFINHSAVFAQSSSYNFYKVEKGASQRKLISSVPVREPAYVHHFGLSEHYLVLVEHPLVVNWDKLTAGAVFMESFKWVPERGTNFLVIRREDGKLVNSFKTEPFFSFHLVNAFEAETTLVVDLVAYPDERVFNHNLLLEVLKQPTNDKIVAPVGHVQRFRLPLSSQTSYVAAEQISGELIEMPRINYVRNNARSYRYVYATGVRQDYAPEFWNELVKIDSFTGTSVRWFEEGVYPGEGVFVEAPNAQSEDDGVVLSVVLDGKKGNSFLVVLDAASFSEIARAELPHLIPFGLHGQYFSLL